MLKVCYLNKRLVFSLSFLLKYKHTDPQSQGKSQCSLLIQTGTDTETGPGGTKSAVQVQVQQRPLAQLSGQPRGSLEDVISE